MLRQFWRNMFETPENQEHRKQEEALNRLMLQALIGSLERRAKLSKRLAREEDDARRNTRNLAQAGQHLNLIKE